MMGHLPQRGSFRLTIPHWHGSASRSVSGYRNAVLPSGGVEEGESPQEAAERELLEESTMVGTSGRLLWVGEHNGRKAFYFDMEQVAGEATLSGPEQEEHSPNNSFTFVWLRPTERGDRRMHPPEIIERLGEDRGFVGG